jgi:hypothetical protein
MRHTGVSSIRLKILWSLPTVSHATPGTHIRFFFAIANQPQAQQVIFNTVNTKKHFRILFLTGARRDFIDAPALPAGCVLQNAHVNSNGLNEHPLNMSV